MIYSDELIDLEYVSPCNYIQGGTYIEVAEQLNNALNYCPPIYYPCIYDVQVFNYPTRNGNTSIDFNNFDFNNNEFYNPFLYHSYTENKSILDKKEAEKLYNDIFKFSKTIKSYSDIRINGGGNLKQVINYDLKPNKRISNYTPNSNEEFVYFHTATLIYADIICNSFPNE